ncbi:uncharacterized protein LOC126918152 [Bombus affinis]|uniref:uncharacterized protein LOC126918152 n=1 Tax=Bombus affinis TaxID=309941 RepID=UPI0021B7BEA6|nr:uncharacterized protein LOC126918152 [Bombus affinis]
MPTPAKINNLRKRRDKLFEGTLTTIRDRIDRYEQSGMQDLAYLRSSQALLQTGWKRFLSLQDELDDIEDEDIVQERVASEQYSSLDERIQHLREGKPSSIPPPSKGTDFPEAKMHLPEMRLPAFDGKFENWNAFFNTFNSTIDMNSHLTTLQKFHYLRASLVGEAANCVNSLVFHEENYPKALSLLKQRYDCPRRIVSCHGFAIIDYPKLTHCSPMALRDLANVVRQNLDALSSLGQTVYPNSLILDLISSKLPDYVRQQWELTLTNKEVPQYTDLLDYLENLALTGISPSDIKQIKTPDQSKRIRQRKTRGQTFTASRVKNSCHSCKGQHSIWHCDAFRAKSVSERLKEVKSALLCLNCLSAGHTTRDCHAGSCRIKVPPLPAGDHRHPRQRLGRPQGSTTQGLHGLQVHQPVRDRHTIDARHAEPQQGPIKPDHQIPNYCAMT